MGNKALRSKLGRTALWYFLYCKLLKFTRCTPVRRMNIDDDGIFPGAIVVNAVSDTGTATGNRIGTSISIVK